MMVEKSQHERLCIDPIGASSKEKKTSVEKEEGRMVFFATESLLSLSDI